MLACLAATNAQISSHSMRVVGRFRRVLLWYSAQAAPSSRSSFMIVFCANPVRRLVERIELPSTNARMICARSVLFSLFILLACLRVVTAVCRND